MGPSDRTDCKFSGCKFINWSYQTEGQPQALGRAHDEKSHKISNRKIRTEFSIVSIAESDDAHDNVQAFEHSTRKLKSGVGELIPPIMRPYFT
jgi:coenzyme F420-reducing hydrogenase delta subunit